MLITIYYSHAVKRVRFQLQSDSGIALNQSKNRSLPFSVSFNNFLLSDEHTP